MNRSIHPVIGIALSAALCGEIYANHSQAQFDTAQRITLYGTVRSFTWANPHGWVILNVEPQDAPTPKHAGLWQIQTASPSQLAKQGWTRQTLKSGDKITIEVSPALNESGRALAGFIKIINAKAFLAQ